jgi:hypothetical protein
MKDATIAAASGLPFETWISRSLAACLFVPLLFPPVHGAFRSAKYKQFAMMHAGMGSITAYCNCRGLWRRGDDDGDNVTNNVTE